MQIRVDVLTTAGLKVGAGPIMTAVNWKSVPRLDKAGEFSFEVPAAEPRTSYLAYHNIAVGSVMMDGAWTEIGRGIIDTIQVAGGSNPTMLTVSGNDMLRELAWRSVGDLVLATPTTAATVNTGVTSLAPTDVHSLKIDVGGSGGPYGPFPYMYNGYNSGSWFNSNNIFDGNLSTSISSNLGSWHFWYVCYDDPYVAANVFLSTFNTDTCNWVIQYFNGTNWIDLTVVSDGTMSGGKTFAQNGTITWDLPADWQPLEQSVCPGNLDPSNSANYVNLTGYWTRWLPQTVPADGDGGSVIVIKEITIAGLVPTAQAAAQILGIADGLANAVAAMDGTLTGSALPTSPPSLGWTFDATDGQVGTLATDVFAQIQDDTVLAALTKLSELTNEHFRVGSGNQLVWLGQNTPSSGIRAIRAPRSSQRLEGNAAICQITSLTRSIDTAALITRVIPYGGGNQDVRTTLSGTTRPTTATFTDPQGIVHSVSVDTTNNYIIDSTAEATYGRIEGVVEWNYVTARDQTPPNVTLAANALYDVALVYLTQHSQPVQTFSVTVTGLSQVLLPGQTIQVIWRELNDATTILDINQTLIILEATNEVTQQGFFTTALTLSQYPRWPLSDMELLAKLEQQLRHISRYPQPLSVATLATPVSMPAPAGLSLYASGRGYVSFRSSASI